MAVEVVVDVVVVVEPVFIVGMTAADSFFSFSLSALSSDQYLRAQTHGCKRGTGAADGRLMGPVGAPAGETGGASAGGGAQATKACG